MSNRKVCFFGHSDTPWSVQPKLREVILDLIDNEGANELLTEILTVWLRRFSRNCRKHGLFASTSCLRIHRQKKKKPR